MHYALRLRLPIKVLQPSIVSLLKVQISNTMSTDIQLAAESGNTSGIPSLSESRDAELPAPKAVNSVTTGDSLMYSNLPFIKTLSDKLHAVFRDSAVLVCKGTDLESVQPTPLVLIGRPPLKKGYGTTNTTDDVIVYNIVQRMFCMESLASLKRFTKKVNRINRRVFDLNELSTLAVGTCVLYVHMRTNKANLAIVMREDTVPGTVLVVKFSLKRRSAFEDGYSQLLLPTKGAVCETVSLDEHVIYKVNGFRFDNIRWNHRNTTCGSEHIYVLSIGINDVLIHRQYASMLNQTSHRELAKSTVKMVHGTPPLAITDVPRAAIIGGVERSDHNQDNEEDNEEEEEEEGQYTDGEHNDDSDDNEEREDNQDNQDNDERRERLGEYFASETDSTAGDVAHNAEGGVFLEFPVVSVLAERMEDEGEAEPNPAEEVDTGEEAEFAIDGSDVIDCMHDVGSRKRTNPVKERDSNQSGQYSKSFVEKVRGFLSKELFRLSNLCNDDEHASLEKGLADVGRQIHDVQHNIALLKHELAGLQEKRRGLINKSEDRAHIEQQKTYMKMLLDVSPPHKQPRLSV
jgi:hypothetical protein